MTGALNIIAEAILRTEHKIDALLRHLKVQAPAPMHFQGSSCPACGVFIDYQVDIQHQVVARRCNCTTGKVVVQIPLLPLSGAPNAGPEREQPEPEPEERRRR